MYLSAKFGVKRFTGVWKSIRDRQTDFHFYDIDIYTSTMAPLCSVLVQQCTKRIKAMDLEGSLKEMMDLCPKETELVSAEYCTVPSQPILELVSMKILGACKLLVRLMDCCCKAFHLCLQHLSLDEFIVMNVVLLGLSSRLWVMYRGLLNHLIAFYSSHICLQKQVSDIQRMPYVKDFVFPATIEDHIGSVFNDLFTHKQKNLLVKKRQIFSKIFATTKRGKLSKIGDIDTKTFVDVGQPIQMQRFNRGKLDNYDVKALFLPVKTSRLQGVGSKKDANESKKKLSLSLHSRKEECVRHLVPKIQECENFRALSQQLLYAVKWCKERKLKAEAMFFKKRNLRCNRLQHAEALGYSLNKKLHCWKKSLCHNLREQTQPKPCLILRRSQQTWKRFAPFSQRHRRLRRRDLKRSPQCLDLVSEEQMTSSAATDPATGPTSAFQDSSAVATDQCLTDVNDIDDIFSSIGI
ncbi:nucleolus and neural progenitor protein isoform X2 [Dendropsophus ebraccatus]|uniref:nucleolus and neural progenitor protein isoform X2 n=1 Tax=Dendropsophus ebraccatus TaxID=150705 RepID=UPI003831E690